MNIYGVLSITTRKAYIPFGCSKDFLFEQMDKVLSDLECKDISLSAFEYLALDNEKVKQSLLSSNIPQKVKDLINNPPPFNHAVLELLHEALGEFSSK